MPRLETVWNDTLISVDEGSLRRLQAIWKGTVVRKKIATINAAYVDIISELEPTDKYAVVWEQAVLCYPKLVLKRELQRQETRIRQDREDVSNNISKSEQFEQVDSSVESTNTADQKDIPHDTVGDNQLNNIDKTVIEIPTKDVCDVMDTHLIQGVQDKNVQTSLDGKLGEIEAARTDVTGCNPTRDNPETLQPTRDVGSGHSQESDKMRGAILNLVSQEAVSELPGISMNGHSTSIWDDTVPSPSLQNQAGHPTLSHKVSADDCHFLEEERQNLVMELLWVQQAIESRKQYLRLKAQMSGGSNK